VYSGHTVRLSLGQGTRLVPVSCCGEKDCRALVEADGETVLETADGWRLWDGRLVKRGMAKLSPDGTFHLFETRSRSILCFFVPPGSS
jgi:hypothetical protein